MGTSLSFIELLLPLYFMILIGFLGRKLKVLSKATNEVLTQLLLYISLPCLILSSLNIPFSLPLVRAIFFLILMSLFQFCLSIILAYYCRKHARLSPEEEPVYESLLIFGNQGFMGASVSYMLAGGEGVIYISFFNIVYLLLLWTYGIYLFTKGRVSLPWRSLLFNPGLLATGIGLCFFLFSLSLPLTVRVLLEELGKTTVPLSMILIGSMLAELRLKIILALLKNRYIWYASVLKLIVIPSSLLLFLCLKPPFKLFSVAFMTAAMPSAPTISLYAQKFGGSTAFSSLGVIHSTLLCFITLPLLYWLLGYLYRFL